MKIYLVTGYVFDCIEGCMVPVSSVFVTREGAEEYFNQEFKEICGYVNELENEIGDSSIEIEDRKYINHPFLHTARVTFNPKATDIPNDKGEPVYHYDERATELALWFSGMGDYKCEKMTATHKSAIKLLDLRIVEYNSENLK